MNRCIETLVASFPHYCRSGALIVSLILLAGCAASNSETAKTPSTKASPFVSNGNLTSEDIDIRVQGFGDTFIARIAMPYGQIIATAKSREVRSWALSNRLGQAIATLADSTGPNPVENLLDLVVMVTLKRMSIQEHWIPDLLHEDGKDLLEAYKQSEAQVWDLAAKVFTPGQCEDLRATIEKWKSENPKTYALGFIKFTDFVGGVSRPSDLNKSVAPPTSLLTLLSVDPLVGLDPVTQEARGFRMLSERVVFIAMRTPVIMNWQIEDATQRMLNSPEIQRVITSTEEYAKVGDRFNDIAARYPDEYSKATQRAIDQLDAAATQQRQEIVKVLNSESAHVHEILADARDSVQATQQSTAAMNADMVQTIAAAKNASQSILRMATICALIVIFAGFVCPAVILFAYRYAANRWLPPRRLPDR